MLQLSLGVNFSLLSISPNHVNITFNILLLQNNVKNNVSGKLSEHEHFNPWCLFYVWIELVTNLGLNNTDLEIGQQPQIKKEKYIFPKWLVGGCWRLLISLQACSLQCFQLLMYRFSQFSVFLYSVSQKKKQANKNKDDLSSGIFLIVLFVCTTVNTMQTYEPLLFMSFSKRLHLPRRNTCPSICTLLFRV